MTDADLSALIASLRDALRPHLARSETLRRLAHELGQILVDEAWKAQAAEGSGSATEAAAESGNAASSATVEAGAPSQLQPREHVATVPLRLADETVDVKVSGSLEGIARARRAAAAVEDVGEVRPTPSYDQSEAPIEIDLAMVERRCRLKADSCRLYIRRRGAFGDPIEEAPILDTMNEMIAEAKSLPHCFLWVFWRESKQPEDETLRKIARCYEAMAEAVALVRRVEELDGRLHEEQQKAALQLLAQAGSALRVALQETWLTRADEDQDEVHNWIRRTCNERGIFLARYMKLEDPADPADADSVIEAVGELAAAIKGHASRLKRIDEAFKKIRYHVQALGYEGDGEDAHDFRKIAEAIEALAELGVPPSDRRFRDVIEQRAAEFFPLNDDTSKPVAAAVGFVRQWHNSTFDADDQAVDAGGEPGDGWSEQVLRVRGMLAGRRIVVIGGERRPDQEKRMRDAFDLDDVEWVRLAEHGSGEPMRAPISRPGTAAVIIIIRLAGHQHADEAKAYARSAGVPVVLIPAGHHPERIAEAILQQASEQLAPDVAST